VSRSCQLIVVVCVIASGAALASRQLWG